MTSLDKLYQDELKLLKDSARVFNEQHPALTEHLVKESNDPDVEMIMQGVAYLTAKFKQELEEPFSQALQSLSQVLAPALMQPIPASAILSFKPKVGLLKPITVKADAYFDSKAVTHKGGSHPCRFKGSWDTEVLPITLNQISQNYNEQQVSGITSRLIELKLEFDSSRNDLANFSFDKIRLFINQPLSDASLWLFMFAKQLVNLELKDKNSTIALNTKAIKLIGFEEEFALFDFDSVAQSHRVLQEYFIQPDKFLFIEIDVSAWQSRMGENFSLTCRFTQPNWPLPELLLSHLHLFAMPIVNQFEHFCEPTAITNKDHHIALVAKSDPTANAQALSIIDIKSVESILQGREINRKFENILKPNSLIKRKSSFYFFRKHGTIDGEVSNWLALEFPAHKPLVSHEVLRAKVICCHGAIAQHLALGDINKPTSTSSELMTFENITLCTEYQYPQIASESAWHVISDQALSITSIKDVEQLKQILKHHIPNQNKLSAKQKTNLFRIEALEKLVVIEKDHFNNGALSRGKEFKLSINGDNFTNVGDMFLFCSIINKLLALSTPINSFSQLKTIDLRTGESLEWPILVGKN